MGWGETAEETAQASLNDTLFHVCVRKNEQLVGMGRVIGDGHMYFYIQDVVIRPEFQNQGIGRLVMGKIEEYLAINAKSGATVGLLSAKGKEGFYKGFGYIERPNETLGNGMCKFV